MRAETPRHNHCARAGGEVSAGKGRGYTGTRWSASSIKRGRQTGGSVSTCERVSLCSCCVGVKREVGMRGSLKGWSGAALKRAFWFAGEPEDGG